MLSSLISVPLTLTVTLAAGLAAATAETDESERDAVVRAFDRVWSFATLYESADDPVLQKLALVGRFQVDFPVYDSNHGNYDDPQVRRFRAGAKSRWLQDFTLHAEVDIDFDCDRGEDCDDSEYEGLTDAYVGWDRYPHDLSICRKVVLRHPAGNQACPGELNQHPEASVALWWSDPPGEVYTANSEAV